MLGVSAPLVRPLNSIVGSAAKIAGGIPQTFWPETLELKGGRP